MKEFWEETKRFAKETLNEYKSDKVARLAAALSYYTIFSLPPLLLIVMGVVGIFVARSTARDQLLQEISNLVGQGAANAVSSILQSAGQNQSGGWLSNIVGIVTLIVGATGVFGQLQEAMNTVWDVMPKPSLGIMQTIKNRFLSFAMVLGIAFLLLVSLLLSTGLALIGGYLRHLLPNVGILQLLTNIVTFGITIVLFALIFKLIPDVEIRWRDVWVGGAITAFLFTIGKFALGYYLGRSAPGSTYGAAGSLVLILLWVYYSTQILFMGAEITQVYTRFYGSGVRPADNAIWAPVQEPSQGDTPSEKEEVTREDESESAGKPSSMASTHAFDHSERTEVNQVSVDAPRGIAIAVGVLATLMERPWRDTHSGSRDQGSH